MKILLYTEGLKTIGKSGLGKAIKHQMTALEDNGIEYTLNPKEDYDIAHINFYGLKSYFLAKKTKKLGKKVVYHAHSTEEDFRNSFIFSNLLAPLFKRWIIKCYSLGDYIITPTPYSKRLLENYGIKKPIVAISNGIDLNKFNVDKEAGNKFRNDYHIQNDEKVIIGIGIYVERKGILDFVELAKRLPQYKFIWFGYSPLTFSPIKIRKAVKTKLDNLTFAGYVDPSVLVGAYNGADLYIFPTHEETEGIPAMEAAACKINSIISDIPVFDGWLYDKQNVYKAKTLDEFEDKIKKMLNGELKSLTNEAYQMAENRDIKKVGEQLISIYKELL